MRLINQTKTYKDDEWVFETVKRIGKMLNYRNANQLGEISHRRWNRTEIIESSLFQSPEAIQLYNYSIRAIGKSIKLLIAGFIETPYFIGIELQFSSLYAIIVSFGKFKVANHSFSAICLFLWRFATCFDGFKSI